MTVQRLTARALPLAVLAAELLFAAPAAARTTPGAAATAARTTTAAAQRQSRLFASERTPLHVAAATPKAASGGSAVGGGVLRTIIALIVVIGVIYGVAWVLRRLRRSSQARASGRGLASVATLPLGGGRSLHLVRAGVDLILVGASEHGVTPIRSYGEAEARASGLLGDDEEGVELERLVPPAAVEWQPAPDWHAPPRATGHAPGTIGHALETLRRLTVRQ